MKQAAPLGRPEWIIKILVPDFRGNGEGIVIDAANTQRRQFSHLGSALLHSASASLPISWYERCPGCLEKKEEKKKKNIEPAFTAPIFLACSDNLPPRLPVDLGEKGKPLVLAAQLSVFLTSPLYTPSQTQRDLQMSQHVLLS